MVYQMKKRVDEQPELNRNVSTHLRHLYRGPGHLDNLLDEK